MERLYYEDLFDIYTQAGGKGNNIVVYYCLPGQSLDNGIRVLNGDDGIIELLRACRGLDVIPLYFEEKQGPSLVIDTQGNIIPTDDQIPSLPYHNEPEHTLETPFQLEYAPEISHEIEFNPEQTPASPSCPEYDPEIPPETEFHPEQTPSIPLST
ncbi:hypothetical protein Salat_2956600 [Sesamum alatum]|uniref:Uncharacterized protein n=1 Tax=Sesamum alatum TaxID=300844 RepID=A0AAE1XJW9_9LAMI|nr:hypothetical protein Salat_2956600 [Sesamum alatum]